jgi:hypothetical protein
MPEPKQWTVLVWIAGDHDLDEFGLADIGEMKRVGSNDDVDVVVQFDRWRDQQTGAEPQTSRYHLHRDTTLEEDLVEELGETNTGDPQVAIDFFSWGIERCPADKVLAIIWNHGSGIDETDIFKRSRERGVPVVRRGAPAPKRVPRERARRVAASPYRRSLFWPTVERALDTRAIAIDWSARDFLDNAELRQVLEQVRERTGRPIDVLGFDACLMNMIEVAYELRGLARYIVGSEETEPGDGWPYEAVVGTVANKPDAGPGEVAKELVKRYLESYAGDTGVTQSAFDLAHAEGAAEAASRLASACVAALDGAEDYSAISKAVKNVQRFELKDFADLGDFCRRLVEGGPSDPVSAAARELLDSLTGDGGLVTAAGQKGPGVEGATGAAVYFPIVGDVTVAYDQLAYAKDTDWDELVTAYSKS